MYQHVNSDESEEMFSSDVSAPSSAEAFLLC